MKYVIPNTISQLHSYTIAIHAYVYSTKKPNEGASTPQIERMSRTLGRLVQDNFKKYLKQIQL